jgi:hypothetical protein
MCHSFVIEKKQRTCIIDHDIEITCEMKYLIVYLPYFRPKDQMVTSPGTLPSPTNPTSVLSPNKKHHVRARSDVTGVPQVSLSAPQGHHLKRCQSAVNANSMKALCGDLTSGRAFDNGCTCFDSEEGVLSDLKGMSIECHCGVSIVWFQSYCFTV